MFQDFTTKSDPSVGPVRVAKLRQHMRTAGVDIVIVPHADEYQNEYLPPCAERLAWLTGFTGSAGAAIITMDNALVFADGRYTLQVRSQTDPDTFKALDLVPDGVQGWLDKHLQKGQRIGIDPWLHTPKQVERLGSLIEARGAHLVELDRNPIDAIWTDQPVAPVTPVTIHPHHYAGTLARRKLADITKAVRQAGADAHVITDTTAIAWSFNIRGSDVDHTPLTLARAIIPKKGLPLLFIDDAKLGIETRAYLTQLCDVRPENELLAAIEALASRSAKVMIDCAQAPYAIAHQMTEAGGTIIDAPDPTRLPRACKNRTEIKGTRAAHLRDGVAMVHFLAWLDVNAETPGLDEITIATELEEARRATGERFSMPLMDISFDTISGSGPNGAIVHYRVDESSNRGVEPGDLILIDSGGQYLDGTTDITRVVPAGEPTEEHCRHFTLVLKGMIGVSVARFPVGTRGMDIDVLARNALWQNGLDYAHGTGHGVGSYLGVHEGPQNISKRGTVALQTGMIISNEPGYYETGSHGIRIENLVLVTAPKVPKGGVSAMHGFETLTLCPIDRRLIDKRLLTPAERRWVNRYHATVKRKLMPLIDDIHVRDWLEAATARL